MLATLVLAQATAWASETTRRLGSHTMIGPSMDPPTVDALFQASVEAHLATVRLDVVVAWLFPQSPEQPNWQSLDVVRAAARRYHESVLGLLSGTPFWNARCPAIAVDFYRCPPSDYGAWARMVEQIAAHAPEIRYWEILNEANLGNVPRVDGEYFYGDPVEYARLLRVTSRAIRRGNPAAKVVFTGVIEPYDRWLDGVLRQPGTVASFDIANAHFRGGLRKLDDMVRAAKRLFAAYGFRGPLWVTEMGYPSDPVWQWDPEHRGTEAVSGQAAQERYEADAIRILLRSGARRVFVTLRDLDYAWGPFASEGLLNWPVPTRKRSYFMVKQVGAAILRRASRAGGRAPGGSARARAHPRRARARPRGRASTCGCAAP